MYPGHILEKQGIHAVWAKKGNILVFGVSNNQDSKMVLHSGATHNKCLK